MHQGEGQQVLKRVAGKIKKVWAKCNSAQTFQVNQLKR
jgi:hypothetical protein